MMTDNENFPLHISIHGQGDPLVLLHGWGFHGDIWQPVTAHLAQNTGKQWQVWQVDLPGHGRSGWEDMDLSGCISLLREKLPPGAVWLGWSLGGLLALLAAEQPRGMILCAATPHFTQTADWPHATPATVLAEFAERLSDNQRATLQRFLALQVRGGDAANALLRVLKPMLFTYTPHHAALSAGLDWLAQGDARPQLAALSCPTLLISGQRDTLVPAAVANSCRALNPALQTACIKGAAHIPFLSHRHEFLHYVDDFLAAARY
jgi:pimeloyl-[acyl-carrier protein] methyl ester esterase